MTATAAPLSRMPVVAALQALADACTGETVVITNQASSRIWPKLRQRPLDFHYNPSTMGGAIPLGLGLALAQPKREVVVVSGDGSLLMSLGALVTVTSAAATNLSIVLLDNGLYEVTGGQQTPAAGTAVDYVGLARAAGFATAMELEDVAQWKAGVADALQTPGPRLVRLAVEPTPPEYLRGPTPPMDQQLADLQTALNGSEG